MEITLSKMQSAKAASSADELPWLRRRQWLVSFSPIGYDEGHAQKEKVTVRARHLKIVTDRHSWIFNSRSVRARTEYFCILNPETSCSVSVSETDNSYVVVISSKNDFMWNLRPLFPSCRKLHNFCLCFSHVPPSKNPTSYTDIRIVDTLNLV